MTLLMILGAFLVVVLVAVFLLTPKKPENSPPMYRYLANAFSGKYDLANNGPVKLLEEGYKQCGDVFTLQLGHKRVTLMLGPDGAQSFFKQNDKTLCQRDVYKFTVPVFGPNIVYDSPLKVMYQQLKFLKTGLVGAAMQQHALNIIKETEEFFSALPDQGEIDLHETLSKLTIITASRCLLGKEIRDTLHDKVASLYQDLSDGMTHLTFVSPNFPCEKHRKRDAARKQLVEIFSKSIRARRENPMPPNSDLLQTFIDSEYFGGRKCTDEEICGLLLAALFAGQHTSTITSTWCGLLIFNNDQNKHVEKIRKEQEEALKLTNGELTFASLANMPYLDACVYETLRLYPPLTMLLRTVLKPFKYKDFTIPKGDIVATCPSVNHHIPAVFPEPEAFKPQRFLGAQSAKNKQTVLRQVGSGGEIKSGGFEHAVRKEIHPYAFNAFGQGRHVCLGRHFGTLQIKSIWSTLLRDFDWETCGPMPEIDYAHLVAGPKHPTTVRFKRRNTSASS